jgi:hypothetical protein
MLPDGRVADLPSQAEERRTARRTSMTPVQFYRVFELDSAAWSP